MVSVVICAMSLAACLNSGTVAITKLETPPPRPIGVWQQDVESALEVYRSSHVVSPRDERFGPIFGGITTLAYFTPDLQQKLDDQRLSTTNSTGSSLQAACEARPEQTAPGVLAQHSYLGVWIPLPIVSETVEPTATCDSTGHSSRAEYFCMFGRASLQPAAARPLVIVVHGMFDSSAQRYVTDIGDLLFKLGFSVLLLDMRDHGQTLQAAPSVPTTLGDLEGRDILRVGDLAKHACAGKVDGVGAIGVSAGALDVISAYAADGRSSSGPTLDRGAIALSPLLDVDKTTDTIEHPPLCSVANAVELTWAEHASVGLLGAALFFGGTAVSALASDRSLNKYDAVATAVGAVTGVGLSLLIDAVADGDSATSRGCVARDAISALFRDLLRVRWQTFVRLRQAALLTPEAAAVAPDHVSLRDYLRLRCDAFYQPLGLSLSHADPTSLASRLNARPDTHEADRSKLLVLSSEDDPVTLIARHDQFARSTDRRRSDILITSVRQGGHGAMWVVQPAAMRAVVERFFGQAEQSGEGTRL